MDYIEKIKARLLIPLFIIAAILVSLLAIAFIGFVWGNNGSEAIIPVFIFLMLIILGGYISTGISISGIINIIRASLAGQKVPAKFIVFTLIEFIFGIAWIIFSFVIIGNAMSV